MSTEQRPSRRYKVLFVLVLLPVLLFTAIWAVDRFELFSRYEIFVQQTLFMLAVLSLVVLPVWFFLFSGFAARTRLVALTLLLLAGGGLAACIRDVDFSGTMGMMPIWRWSPDPEEDRLAHKEADGISESKIDLTIEPGRDFPRYRGITFDGLVVPDHPLADDWESTPPKSLWNRPCGGGYAGFAVAGNVAVTLELYASEKEEVVVCYDRKTGKKLWEYATGSYWKDPMHMGDGPRSTPTIADNEIYSLTAMGELVVLKKDGKLKWRKNILEDNGAKNIIWGLSCSPLVVDDRVIVNAGVDPDDNKGRAVVAYSRKDGKLIWAKGEHKAGYSSPQVATLDGVRQVLLFDAGGLVGIDLKTGDELWRHKWITFQDMNITQPLVIGKDRVFISSEKSNGCAALKVKRDGDTWTVTTEWEGRLASKFSNPVFVGGHIYGLSYGRLTCLNAETGDQKWQGPRRGYGAGGQMVTANGLLFILSEAGELFMVAADSKEFRLLGQMKVLLNDEGKAVAKKTWNTPALAGNQMFLRNAARAEVLELPVRKERK